MTEFTKEHPFEFEGVKVWRDEVGQVRQSDRTTEYIVAADAIHAFIEAESAEWRWVEEGKVARKGRWEARVNGVVFDKLTHDDFHLTAFWARPSGANGPEQDAQKVWDSFAAWLAAHSQPAEPTTFGYVGGLARDGVPEWDLFRRALGHIVAVRRHDGYTREFRDTWPQVLALGTFEPVTR